MRLLQLADRIKNRKVYNSLSGTIDRIFEIYERDGKKITGEPYIIIKPEPEEKKLKKSLN
jgi:hypothetical protein|tara:strand:- start:7930 stop:8109 length:180 start_codon:yes stop_codon:yes gene_type:complete